MKLHEPDFSQMLKVLRREVPDRPVLFELFMNNPLYELVLGEKPDWTDRTRALEATTRAFVKMGYDYVTTHASAFGFNRGEVTRKQTYSLNDGAVITDEKSFEAYAWNNPEDYDDSALGKAAEFLPDGMKLMCMGPGGVLENVIALTGYDNLCIMVYENPDLAKAIFDEVGVRLVKYYEAAVQYDTVGLVSSNDDWGFNSQTFLSPADMRKYVFPWHRRIVEVCHNAGKPVFLHSCGYMDEVIDDIVDIGFDAKHSFEDKIKPIEKAYDEWHNRIALLGGIDMDYVCRKTPEEVYNRTVAMIERTANTGGWAVGTGNSVPTYVPVPQFGALLKAGLGYDPFTL